MKLLKTLRRFAIPGVGVTAWYLLRERAMVSPRAEVEIHPRISIGKGTEVSAFCKLKSSDDGFLRVGRHVSIGSGAFLSAESGGVEIGDYCMVGPNVCIIGNNYRYDRLDVPMALQEKTSKGIRIADNVWIGAGTVILDGAQVGAGAIIAPNSVVSGRVAENSIVQSAGPARKIFERR